MMRHILFSIIGMLLILNTGFSQQKKTDYSGKWSGPAQTTEGDQASEVILEIKYEAGKYSGKAADAFGFLSDTPMEKFTIKKDSIFFTMKFDTPNGMEASIICSGTISANEMKLKFDMPEMGRNGTMDLKREEKKE